MKEWCYFKCTMSFKRGQIVDNMVDQGIYKLKIDDEFRWLIPPLSVDEMQQLEDNLVRDGCREPICVWFNTILDGHNRYEICNRLLIPFAIRRVSLKNREEAIAWICINQLGRRNITNETRKYLIGKRYEMEKILGAHNSTGTNQHSEKEVRAKMLPEPPYEDKAIRTRERLGAEYNMSHTTVFLYGKYSEAIDKLTTVVPDITSKILSGKAKITRENVVELSQLPSLSIKRLSVLLLEDETKFQEGLRKLIPEKQRILRKHIVSAGTVKEMPVYDPDAEISGLTLTVPSWVSSIERARSSIDLISTTINARLKLNKELLKLKETIDLMIADMEVI